MLYIFPVIYMLFLLISYIILAVIMRLKNLHSATEKAIVFHQTNIYHNGIWIPLSLLLLLNYGGLPWVIINASFYIHTLRKGKKVLAICKAKKIKKYKNPHFGNIKRIVEIQYYEQDKKYNVKTQVPEEIFNLLDANKEFFIQINRTIPSFWVYVKKSNIKFY